MLDHRRASDRRLDADALDVVLQQQAFRRRAGAAPVPAPAPVVVDLVERTVDLREPEVELDPCPLCGVLLDRLWLFRHVAVEH